MNGWGRRSDQTVERRRQRWLLIHGGALWRSLRQARIFPVGETVPTDAAELERKMEAIVEAISAS